MLVMQIQTKAQFAAVSSDIQNNRLVCNGISFHATRQSERLTNVQIAAFLSMLRGTWQSLTWTTLHLSGHRLTEQLDLSFLLNLRFLDLHDNYFTSMPILPTHSLLKTINIDSNSLSKTPYLPAHPNLREFSISYNNLTQSFHDLHKMAFLQKLYASENDFTSVPLDDFRKPKLEYHLSSRLYTHAARVLANAANKHLSMHLYGYMRIIGEAPQLSSEDLQRHFKIIAYDFEQVCASNDNRKHADALLPTSEFVSQNFVSLSVLSTTPRLRKLAPEITDKILSFLVPAIDPLSREFNKFTCVFKPTAGLGYPVFDASKLSWQQFVQSQDFKDIKNASENRLSKCRMHILKDLQKNPCVKSLLFLNHRNAGKPSVAAANQGRATTGQSSKKQRLS